MATLEMENARAIDARRSRVPWWIYLATGIAWLLAALVVLRFDITSVKAVGVLLGVVLLAIAAVEVVTALSAPGWRWAHWLMAAAFAVGGIGAIVHPLDAFWTLASILGVLLVLKGSFDIVRSISSKSVNDAWAVGLVAGIVEVLLAFWVSQQYFEPRAAFIIAAVGFSSILRGIGDIATAFELRGLQRDTRG
jgi:uncharacterized membrane protein HdeD (DUF308 family)